MKKRIHFSNYSYISTAFAVASRLKDGVDGKQQCGIFYPNIGVGITVGPTFTRFACPGGWCNGIDKGEKLEEGDVLTLLRKGDVGTPALWQVESGHEENVPLRKHKQVMDDTCFE